MKNSHESQNSAAQNVEGNHPPTVSARKPKSESNRENAKKSTGPKTTRGKANSRFNALKHGLCAKRVMFSAQGKLVEEGLLKLLESLQEQYGGDDVRVQLLCDAIATEYWRQGQGLRVEMKFLNQTDMHFTNRGGMGVLQRYLTGSQRALLKNLQLLDKIQPQLPSTKQPAVSEVPEGDGAAGGRKASKNGGANGQTHTPALVSPKPGSGPAKQAANNSEASASVDIRKLA